MLRNPFHILFIFGLFPMFFAWGLPNFDSPGFMRNERFFPMDEHSNSYEHPTKLEDSHSETAFEDEGGGDPDNNEEDIDTRHLSLRNKSTGLCEDQFRPPMSPWHVAMDTRIQQRPKTTENCDETFSLLRNGNHASPGEWNATAFRTLGTSPLDLLSPSMNRADFARDMLLTGSSASSESGKHALQDNPENVAELPRDNCTPVSTAALLDGTLFGEYTSGNKQFMRTSSNGLLEPFGDVHNAASQRLQDNQTGASNSKDTTHLHTSDFSKDRLPPYQSIRDAFSTGSAHLINDVEIRPTQQYSTSSSMRTASNGKHIRERTGTEEVKCAVEIHQHETGDFQFEAGPDKIHIDEVAEIQPAVEHMTDLIKQPEIVAHHLKQTEDIHSHELRAPSSKYEAVKSYNSLMSKFLRQCMSKIVKLESKIKANEKEIETLKNSKAVMCAYAQILKQKKEKLEVEAELHQKNAIDIFHELAVLQITVRKYMGIDLLKELRKLTTEALREMCSMGPDEIEQYYQEHIHAVETNEQMDVHRQAAAAFQHSIIPGDCSDWRADFESDLDDSYSMFEDNESFVSDLCIRSEQSETAIEAGVDEGSDGALILSAFGLVSSRRSSFTVVDKVELEEEMELDQFNTTNNC